MLILLGSRGTHDSPWVWPGCLDMDMEVELEGAVVMAEDEQAPEPSSEGWAWWLGQRRRPCAQGCLWVGSLSLI